jgi:hypothetical protein
VSMSLRKNKRQESILLSLDKLDYLTREQLQRLHRLKSTHNTNRILRDMGEFLHFMSYGKSRAYYLSQKGRERVGSEKKRIKTMQIEHYIMRNEAYFYFECPSSWKNEPEIPQPVKMFPDASFEKNKHTYLVEIDNKQNMVENAEKARKYKQLKEHGVTGRDGVFPTIVWVTLNDIRKKRIQKLCDGLECKILTYEEIK